jgi:hypothetical protein
VLKAFRIRGLQQAWTKDAVDFDRGADDVAGLIVERGLHQHADQVSKPDARRFCQVIR